MKETMNRISRLVRRRMTGTLPLLTVTGLAGFLLGVFLFPSWHDAVETGQVVAGIVRYPEGNPYGLYHHNLWTILTQFSALLLKTGLSEISASLLLSGLAGMISFQAVTLSVYAVCRNMPAALAAPLFILFAGYAGTGAVYPIALMGHRQSFGIFGLSFAVLTLGAAGAGFARLACFLLGFIFCIHLPWGLWCWGILGTAALFQRKQIRQVFSAGGIWLAAGLCVSLISFATHRLMRGPVPPFDAHTAREIFLGFIRYYDFHRKPFPFWSHSVLAGIAGCLLSAHLLKNKETAPATKLFLTVYIVSFLLSIAAAVLTHIPPEQVPFPLLILMPGRFINFTDFLFVPLLFATAAVKPETRLKSALISILVLTSLIYSSALALRIPGLPPWIGALKQMLPAAAALGMCYAPAGRPARRAPAAMWIFTLICIAGFSVWAAGTATRHAGRLRSWTFSKPKDSVLSAAARREGLLLASAEFSSIQLFTRRPVLIDPQVIDAAIYQPASILALYDIALKLYGTDLCQKPPGDPYPGQIPVWQAPLWNRWTAQRWQQVRSIYGVRDVLTPAEHYHLPLPVIASNSLHVLYTIPPPEEKKR